MLREGGRDPEYGYEDDDVVSGPWVVVGIALFALMILALIAGPLLLA